MWWLLFIALLSDPDSLLEVRVDLAADDLPTAIAIYETPDRQVTELGDLLASDNSFLDVDGTKKQLRCVFPADRNGDGVDEICAVIAKIKKNDLQLRVYAPPLIVNGQTKTIASSKKKSFGPIEGDGRVVLAGAVDLEADGKDKVFTIREAEDGRQYLEITRLPKKKNKKMKPPIASDATFGHAVTDENIFACGADINGDGFGEIVCVRRGEVGPERLLVFTPPRTLDGETGPPVVSDEDIDPFFTDQNLGIGRIDLNRDMVDELVLLRSNSTAGDRVEIVSFPLTVGGSIGSILFTAPVGSVADDIGAFAVTGLRGFEELPPPPTPNNIAGSYAVGLSHSLAGVVNEVIPPFGPVNGTQVGSSFSLLLPVFNPLPGQYDKPNTTLFFSLSPVEVNILSSGQTYVLLFQAGTVSWDQGYLVIDGKYTGVKKAITGDIPVTDGNYRFLQTRSGSRHHFKVSSRD